MKERPILFSGAMVRAILDGRKTQTRRVIKPQPQEGRQWPCDESCLEWDDIVDKTDYYVECGHCPYGQPGDRLWVRESFWAAFKRTEYSAGCVYLADAGTDRWLNAKSEEDAKAQWKFKPSIHMPRWASRITLEVVKIRVERIQDCSEGDARSEGAPLKGRPLVFGLKPTYLGGFATRWDDLNDKRGFGWEKNPWVWVIEFKRVQP